MFDSRLLLCNKSHWNHGYTCLVSNLVHRCPCENFELRHPYAVNACIYKNYQPFLDITNIIWLFFRELIREIEVPLERCLENLNPMSQNRYGPHGQPMKLNGVYSVIQDLFCAIVSSFSAVYEHYNL